MNYHQTWAAKGQSGSREQHLPYRSNQRAAVNIYKTASSYEMLVFAPGRIKEHFHLDVRGNVLIISYDPPTGFPRPDWIRREYSRGGFVRQFPLDDTLDKSGIQARYQDGVLQVSIPILPGHQSENRQIVVS